MFGIDDGMQAVYPGGVAFTGPLRKMCVSQNSLPQLFCDCPPDGASMRALVTTLLTTGIVQLGTLASGMAAARLLQPDGRGELQAAMLGATLLAYLFIFGLQDAVMYRASAARSQGEHRRIFASALVLGLALAATAMLTGIGLVIPLFYGDYRADVVLMAQIFLLIVPLHILGMAFQEQLRGQGRMGAWNLQRILLALAYPALILGAWLLGRADVVGIGVAYILSHLPVVLLPLILLLRSGSVGLAPARDTVAGLFSYGARMHSSAVIAMGNFWLAQVLIAAWMPPAALGLFVVASALAQAVGTVAGSVAMVAWPRACAAPDPATRAQVLGQYLRLTLALVLLGGVFVWFLLPLAVRLLFGASFAEAAPIAQLLLLGVIPLTIKDFLMMAFKAFDRGLSLAKGEALTLAANILLLVLLVRSDGLTGAALAYVAVRWMSVGYYAYLVRRDLRLSLRQLFMPSRDDWALVRSTLAALRRTPTPPEEPGR